MKPFQASYDGTEATPYHFLEVECNEEESEVHVDFRFAEVAKAFVLFVVFHLSEDGLWLYRPSAAPE